MKDFAPEYSRNDSGWVEFPLNDADYRKQIFPEEAISHPAKANMYMVQAIIEYVSDVDETIMDIMAGTGTILLGVLIGRKVIAVELSEKFFPWIEKAAETIDTLAPGSEERIVLINSPCQLVLPIATDHIIFSPPYAQIMKSKGTDKLTREKSGYNFDEYTYTSSLNIGMASEFAYPHLMEKIYRKCFDSIRPDGTLTIIIKDHIKDGKRVELSKTAKDSCEKIGFKIDRWERMYTPGSLYTRIYRSQGRPTVDNEDIIILKKEG